MKDYCGDPDPYPNYRWLRENMPVSVLPSGGGEATYLVTSYELVRACYLDARLSADPRKAVGPREAGAPSLVRSMLNTDPPDHGRLRRIVSQAFGQRPVDAWRPRIAEICRAAIGRFAANGSADLMADYALIVPVNVIHEILGIPPQLREPPDVFMDQFWRAGVTRAPEPAAIEFVDTYLRRVLAYKRDHPGDDVTTTLLAALDAGELHDEAELMGMLSVLLGPGHITTVPLLASAIVRLLRHPDQLTQALADPARWPDVVEEVLRYDSVVQASTNRYVQEDLTLGDVRVARGSTVLMSIASANRDPAQFADPERFDINRPRRQHLGFGHGAHFCLGVHLGRAEVTVALSTLFEAVPELRLAVPAEEIRWTFGPMMRGPTEVAVIFTPRPDRSGGAHGADDVRPDRARPVR